MKNKGGMCIICHKLLDTNDVYYISIAGADGDIDNPQIVFVACQACCEKYERIKNEIEIRD